jgi:hypothetical protein
MGTTITLGNEKNNHPASKRAWRFFPAAYLICPPRGERPASFTLPLECTDNVPLLYR